MFSGKTEELIRRLRRAQFAGQKIAIFKPKVDVRYSEDNIVSHDLKSIPSIPINSATDIFLMDSDVHKCSEINDVSHCSGELHPRFEVRDIHYVSSKNRLR